jgi:hypothetical protein
MIVATVVPWGSLSRASTASCLVPLPIEAEGMRSDFAGLFATLSARAILVFGGLLLCDIAGSFGDNGTQRRHRRNPAVAPSPAGQDPDKVTGLYLGTATVTLSSPQKSTPFCDET